MRLIAAALLASAAFAQTDDGRVFNFLNISAPRAMQEFVNAARSIAEIRDIAADPQTHSFKLSGTSAQIALTQWLLDSLDQPSSPGAFQCRNTGFAGAERGDTAVEICYPVHLPSPIALQETVNAVRSIADVQRVVAFSAASALLIRATPEAAAVAEWIVRNADEASAGAADRSTRQTRFQDNLVPVARRREAVRLYYPQTIRTPLELQETINALRSILEIQRVVVFSGSAGILLRANDPEAEAADWLISQLDTGAAATVNFGDQVVRTLVIPESRQLADTVNQIRRTTGMQRVVAYQARNTIILRGTAGQIVQAETLLR